MKYKDYEKWNTDNIDYIRIPNRSYPFFNIKDIQYTCVGGAWVSPDREFNMVYDNPQFLIRVKKNKVNKLFLLFYEIR